MRSFRDSKLFWFILAVFVFFAGKVYVASTPTPVAHSALADNY